MKLLKSKFLVRLITVICLFLVLFNLTGTRKVYAESEGWGSVLLKPVIKLLTAIADGIMGVLNKCIEDQSTSFIKIEGTTDWWSSWGAKVLGIITGVVIAAVVLVAALHTAGVTLIVGLRVALPVMLATGAAGYVIADVMDGSYFPEDLYLPVFRVSIDKIFSNKIALLDVNFFNPGKYTKTEETDVTVSWEKKTILSYKVDKKQDNYPTWWKLYDALGSYHFSDIGQNDQSSSGYVEDMTKDALEKYDWSKYNGAVRTLDYFTGSEAFKYIVQEINKKQKEDGLAELTLDSEYKIYAKAYYPKDSDGNVNGTMYKRAKILDSGTGQILFTINYQHNSVGTDLHSVVPSKLEVIREAGSLTGKKKTEVEVDSTAKQLSRVIAKWYFILRNLALLVLMIVLIYSGIRIVIGSTAGEKAKYKERLIDWITAMCLVFMMHYIMIFAMEIVEKITDLVGTATGAYERGAIIKLTDPQYRDIMDNKQEIASQVDSTNGNKNLYWNTDLMGEIKIYSQQEKEGSENWVGMAIAYSVLVCYTVFFIWTYLKRVVYMAFLTMIAPLVAMTYPIDKINDGKAQAFNMWFKEYIFNLLIQPMHLLLYTILVVSAYELAAESIIYTLVAIGFMMPAEKLIRRFFGFEKAQTAALLGGAAGAALAMTGIQNLMRHNSKQKTAEKHENKENSNNIKQVSSKDSVDTFGTLANRGETSNSEKTIKFGTNTGAVANKELEAKSEKVDYGTRLELTTEPRFKNGAIGGSADIKTEEKPGGWLENKKSKLNRVGGVVSGVSENYAKQLGNKVLKRVQNGRPIRTMMRGAAGLAGGALLGLTGATLGIASGDPNKVLQYTSAGAIAGHKGVSGFANSAIDTFSVDTKELGKEVEMSWYGEEYASKKYNEQLEEDLKSLKNVERVRTITGWSAGETEGFLDTFGRECYVSGVTDVDDMLAIKTIMEEEDKDKRISTMKEAIAVTKLKNQLPEKISRMTSKKVDEYEKTYVEAFKPKVRKLHTDWNENQIQNEATKNAKILIKDMKNLDSAKSGLTKV